MRPGAEVIGHEISDEELIVAAANNPDGSIAVVIFNETKNPKNISLLINEKSVEFSIDAQAIQTIVVPKV
jgi:glucosylceramidase